MAGKAIELLHDNALRERLSRDALAWAGEFNWDNSAIETLRVFIKILNVKEGEQ